LHPVYSRINPAFPTRRRGTSAQGSIRPQRHRLCPGQQQTEPRLRSGPRRSRAFEPFPAREFPRCRRCRCCGSWAWLAAPPANGAQSTALEVKGTWGERGAWGTGGTQLRNALTAPRTHRRPRPPRALRRAPGWQRHPVSLGVWLERAQLSWRLNKVGKRQQAQQGALSHPFRPNQAPQEKQSTHDFFWHFRPFTAA